MQLMCCLSGVRPFDLEHPTSTLAHNSWKSFILSPILTALRWTQRPLLSHVNFVAATISLCLIILIFTIGHVVRFPSQPPPPIAPQLSLDDWTLTTLSFQPVSFFFHKFFFHKTSPASQKFTFVPPPHSSNYSLLFPLHSIERDPASLTEHFLRDWWLSCSLSPPHSSTTPVFDLQLTPTLHPHSVCL